MSGRQPNCHRHADSAGMSRILGTMRRHPDSQAPCTVPVSCALPSWRFCASALDEHLGRNMYWPSCFSDERTTSTGKALTLTMVHAVAHALARRLWPCCAHRMRHGGRFGRRGSHLRSGVSGRWSIGFGKGRGRWLLMMGGSGACEGDCRLVAVRRLPVRSITCGHHTGEILHSRRHRPQYPSPRTGCPGSHQRFGIFVLDVASTAL